MVNKISISMECMEKKNPIRGQERKIVSAKIYRPEFANFLRVCQREGKSVNAKLREMIQEEVNKNFSHNIAKVIYFTLMRIGSIVCFGENVKNFYCCRSMLWELRSYFVLVGEGFQDE